MIKMCDVNECQNKEIEVIYYKHKICKKHYRLHCNNQIDLKKIFNIKVEPIKVEPELKREVKIIEVGAKMVKKQEEIPIELKDYAEAIINLMPNAKNKARKNKCRDLYKYFLEQERKERKK